MADVILKQRFVNTEKQPIEAVYLFRQDEGAMYALSVTIDGRVIQAVVEENEEAKEKYSDSIAKGHGAFLLEKGPREDLYQVNIGNLPAGKECLLTVKYVTELEAEGDALKFVLPIARTELMMSSQKEERNDDTQTVDGLNVVVRLQMPSKITNIMSKNHNIQSEINGKQANVRLDTKGRNPVKEFVLIVSLEEPHCATALLEVFKPSDQQQNTAAKEKETNQSKEDKVPHAVMISFFPHIQTDEDVITEAIFLVDRSGSMAGSKMNQTKNALQIFLRSLPLGTYFNIFGFGDRFEKLFSDSVVLTEDTLQRATDYVNALDASLGGTDILPPLRDILERPPAKNLPRQLFVLTDGEVNNTNEVLHYTRKNARTTRIFPLGIGGEADRTLVAGLAKYGRGKAEFVQSGQRLEAPVARQVKKALQPILRNVSVEWSDLPVVPRKVSPSFPPIYDGEKLIIYEFVQNNKSLEDIGKQFEVKVRATTGEKVHEWKVDLNLAPSQFSNQLSNDIVYGDVVHRLTAYSIIKDLEAVDSNKYKDEIIQLAKAWSLVTEHTSFVIEEERAIVTTEAMKFVDVNQRLTAPYKRQFSAMPLRQFYDNGGEGTTLEERAERSTSIEKFDELLTRAEAIADAVTTAHFPSAMESPQQFSPSPDEEESPLTTSSSYSTFHDYHASLLSVSPLQPQSITTMFSAPQRDSNISEVSSPIFSMSLKSKSTPNTQQRPMDRLILLQRANGSFPLVELAEAIQQSAATLQSKLPEILKHSAQAETLWATALALVIFETRYIELKDEWELLATKARKFLERELKKEDAGDVDVLLNLARKALT